MRRDPFLTAALAAADCGWSVFPLVSAGKTPAIRNWEERASRDKQQIYCWWANNATKNIGVAVGKSGLVVVDLDQGRGDLAPGRFAGARNGRDVLAMLAAEAGAELPTDTYTVATPGGCHLYFRAPVGLGLRNTVGTLGWKIICCRSWFLLVSGSCRCEACKARKAGGIGSPGSPCLVVISRGCAARGLVWGELW